MADYPYLIFFFSSKSVTVLQEMTEPGDKFGLVPRHYFSKAAKSAQVGCQKQSVFYISEIAFSDPSQGPFPSLCREWQSNEYLCMGSLENR